MSKADERRSYAVGKTHFMQRLLEQWLVVMEQYTQIAGDNAWWYNERASVSTLAAAAWKNEGWVALEEYSTEKRGTGKGISSGKVKKGRCDLWISSENTTYAIEAKQAYQDVHLDAKQALKAMDLACADISALHPDEANYFYAATFIVLRVKHKGNKDEGGKIIHNTDIDAEIEGWFKSCKEYKGRNRSGSTSYAIYYPEKEPGDIFGYKETHYFPAVVLVLESCPKPS